MKIIILAAGYATRLEPLTTNMPKSLLPIGGRIILDRILDKATSVPGAGAVYIVTNAKFCAQFEEWARTSPHGKRSTVINDGTTSNENRLGAIRDVALALETSGVDDDILLIAGDNLFDFDINRFIAFARSRADGVSIALYDVKDLKAASQYGIVKVDSSSKVVDFQEKPAVPPSTLSSTGIYFFPKNKLPFIGEYVKMQNKLDAPGYYIGWLSKRDKVYGFTFTEDWYDIGSIESYNKADEEYKKKEKKANG